MIMLKSLKLPINYSLTEINDCHRVQVQNNELDSVSVVSQSSIPPK